MSATAWAGVLDHFDEDVERYEAVASGDPDAAVPPRFEPPAELGPLPEALRERAVGILRRMAEAEVLLERRRTSLVQELGVSRKVRDTHPTSTPRFIDRTA